jgi:hypothetical protein
MAQAGIAFVMSYVSYDSVSITVPLVVLDFHGRKFA